MGQLDISATQETNWQLGHWTVLPALNRIEKEGASYQATPKAMATLMCLIYQQGELVSRDDLFDTVWIDTVVSDDTLNRAISDLRQIFGDTPTKPKIIETIRQRGYRLKLPAYPISAKQRPTLLHTKSPRKITEYLGLAACLLLIGLFGFSISRLTDQPPPSYRAMPVTTAPGFEFDVALSFDGQQVAYTASQEEDRQMDLYVKRIGVENPQRLTNSSRIEISAAWSPDGRSIAYLAGDAPKAACGLYIMQLPGGDEQKIADCQSLLVTGVSWSPDGKSIAFSDRPNLDEPYQILLVDVATRNTTVLTAPAAGSFGDFSATFSPDGNSLAFIRGSVASTTALILAPALGDIYTLDLGSGEERKLTHDNQEIPHIDWTPDNEHIVFASHRERGTPGLWRISAEGGEPEWLFGDNAFVRLPRLARNGNRRLVFEQWHNEVSIWQIELDSLEANPDQAQKLVTSTQFDATPQYSPDGKRLAFTSRRSGASEIWISNADGSQPLQLTSFNGPFTSTPRWSPDGEKIAFETRVDGQTDIYIIDAEGGEARQFTKHAFQDMAPAWSLDGKWIYFGSNRNDSWQIWKKPVEGDNPAEQVTRKGGFYASIVPDKQFLYFTRIDTAGLFRTPLSGGVEELVIPDLKHDDWGNWAAVPSGIYYLHRGTLPLLKFYSFQSEAVTTTGMLKYLPLGMVGMAVSPDEKHLAFVRQRHVNADLWMIDHFE